MKKKHITHPWSIVNFASQLWRAFDLYGSSAKPDFHTFSLSENDGRAPPRAKPTANHLVRILIDVHLSQFGHCKRTHVPCTHSGLASCLPSRCGDLHCVGPPCQLSPANRIVVSERWRARGGKKRARDWSQPGKRLSEGCALHLATH